MGTLLNAVVACATPRIHKVCLIVWSHLAGFAGSVHISSDVETARERSSLHLGPCISLFPFTSSFPFSFKYGLHNSIGSEGSTSHGWYTVRCSSFFVTKFRYFKVVHSVLCSDQCCQFIEPTKCTLLFICECFGVNTPSPGNT